MRKPGKELKKNESRMDNLDVISLFASDEGVQKALLDIIEYLDDEQFELEYQGSLKKSQVVERLNTIKEKGISGYGRDQISQLQMLFGNKEIIEQRMAEVDEEIDMIQKVISILDEITPNYKQILTDAKIDLDFFNAVKTGLTSDGILNSVATPEIKRKVEILDNYAQSVKEKLAGSVKFKLGEETIEAFNLHQLIMASISAVLRKFYKDQDIPLTDNKLVPLTNKQRMPLVYDMLIKNLIIAVVNKYGPQLLDLEAKVNATPAAIAIAQTVWADKLDQELNFRDLSQKLDVAGLRVETSSTKAPVAPILPNNKLRSYFFSFGSSRSRRGSSIETDSTISTNSQLSTSEHKRTKSNKL